MNIYEIKAVYSENTIRVYQAFNDNIANQALQLGTFGSEFSLKRMTWIKPSFFWMMYRSGWAKKEGQNRILSIDIKRDAFDFLLNNAVLSTYETSSNLSLDEWKDAIHTSDIRLQWDPERDKYGNPLTSRSVQLGIRGKYVKQYVNEWIITITDITNYVYQLKEKIDHHIDTISDYPDEKLYTKYIVQ